MKTFLLKIKFKYFFIAALSLLIPMINIYAAGDSTGDTSFYIISTLFFAVLVIPVLALLSLILPKNPVYTTNDAVMTLILSFVLLPYPSVKEKIFLHNQSKIISALDKYKQDNNRYPKTLSEIPSIKIPENKFVYQTENGGQDFWLEIYASGAAYGFCSDPVSTKCAASQDVRVNSSQKGHWVKYVYND